jgi:hypothetical protein
MHLAPTSKSPGMSSPQKWQNATISARRGSSHPEKPVPKIDSKSRARYRVHKLRSPTLASAIHKRASKRRARALSTQGTETLKRGGGRCLS